MRTDSGMTHLYEQAARATARGSKSFHFATRFFPADLARSAHAVYWFCRTTDDLVDECPNVDQGRRDLDLWHRQLTRAFAAGDSEHPVLRLFLHAVDRHAIPNTYAFELLDGMRMDLDGVRYETFADLRLFCYRVASTVGLMMSHVIGFEDPAQQAGGLRYAIDLGIALQMTNILRDIGEDLDRGRCYLPSEDLTRFGVDLAHRQVDHCFREMMRFQIMRTEAFYRQAEPGIALLHRRGRFAVEIAARVYERILPRIEANGFDSFHHRAVVPPHEKYWLTARLMTGPVLRHSLGRWAFAR